MPAFVAPLVGFALGAVLAWLSAAAPRRPLARGPSAPALPPWITGAARTAPGSDPRARTLSLAALFSVLVFTPICAYFLVFAPDWSFAYLVDTRRIPSAVDLVLLLIDAASVPAGCFAAARLSDRRSLRASALLAGAPLGAALLAVLVLSRRLAIDANFRQFHGDFGTHPVAGGPLGYALLWMNGLLAAGLILTARAVLTPADREPLTPPLPDNPDLSSRPPPDDPAPPRRLGSVAPPARPRFSRRR
ncbi:MAG: hypothetical protein IT372_21355 [Polyangiaceae bacterium]|nr:hypothetical protein [Polyangiaceae bacterium]